MASEWTKLNLEDLTSILANAKPGSFDHTMAWAEFLRRQTEFIRAQAQAQIKAANCLAWSVVAIAVTSGCTAIFAFLSWYVPHLPH
jgi:hypothetical protein